MKKLFTFKNDAAQIQGSGESSDFLTSETKTLSDWARKISSRLGHEGSVKVIHQDQSGVIGYHLEDDHSGHGQHIQQVAVSHANLLSSL